MKKKCNLFAVIGAIVALAGIAAAVWAFLNRRRLALPETPEDTEEEDLVEYLEDPASEVIPED